MNGQKKLTAQFRKRTGWIQVAGLLAVPLVYVLVGRIVVNPRGVLAGDPAPAFSLPVARGGRCDLTALLARKRVVLLSFIDARPQPFSCPHSGSSRGQVVFLKSMAQQYTQNGVEVLMVGCNQPFGARPLTANSLLNFSYDWQLDGITVLRGDESTISRYGVFTLPMTLLIASDGRIQRRWDGFAPASQLALALEPLVGPPRFRR